MLVQNPQVGHKIEFLLLSTTDVLILDEKMASHKEKNTTRNDEFHQRLVTLVNKAIKRYQ
jgi:hypothetical protein